MNKIFATVVAFGQVYLFSPLIAKAAAAVVPSGLTAGSAALDSAVSGTDVENAGNLQALIASIINVLLGFLGILFLVLVLYAGFLYLTAQGADEPVKKAKKLLTTSIIGLVIIIAAYAISGYVLGALTSIAGVT